MNITNKDLKRRIIEISYKHKLSHLGSVLTAIDIIAGIPMGPTIYSIILSQGHAGLAYYVYVEKHFGIDAELALADQGIHPDRVTDSQNFAPFSTGSLGMGLPAALGMALARPGEDIHCITSDGEVAEGSIQEAFRWFDRNGVPGNLHLHLNSNGYTGYSEAKDWDLIDMSFQAYGKVHKTNVDYLPFLDGLAGHYRTMDESDYKLAMEVLE